MNSTRYTPTIRDNMNQHDVERTLHTALNTAIEVWEKHASDNRLPNGLRDQFERQVTDGRTLQRLIEAECVTLRLTGSGVWVCEKCRELNRNDKSPLTCLACHARRPGKAVTHA